MNFNKNIICWCAAVAAIMFTTRPSFAQHVAGGRSYYINTSGNDNNAGTKNKPFQSVEKIKGLHLAAGDTVYFKSGQTFNGSLLLIQGIAGTPNKPVVFTSYGKGHAIINAKDSVGIKLYNGAFIRLQHLTVVGSGRKAGNTQNGLYILNSKEIKIEDLNISGFQKSGLLIYSSQNIVANHVFVHDNGRQD